MTPVEELSQLAEAATQLRARIGEKALQEPLEALRQSSANAARAWSGSNLGYHADVYYAELQPKPPGAQFSSEWGLEERWPVHVPDRFWRIMDHEGVVDEIVSRAGGHDPKAIDAAIAPIREAFAGLRENSISILSAVLSTTPDSFLKTKLQEIEGLKAPDPSTIARGFLPKGQIFTRDTLALTQGFRVAPHQSVSALPRSAAITASAIDGLEKAARVSASHLHRLEQAQQKVGRTGMTIFIGHGKSPVWRELKEFLEKRLHLSVDEFNSVPVAGIPTAIRLEEMLNAAAFAFLVMTAEDELPDGKLHARLNVVHEAGLFQGRLGFKKAIQEIRGHPLPGSSLQKGVDDRDEPGDDDQEADPLNRAA